MNTKITFEKFSEKHLPLWDKWINVPFVKDVWFIEGYETTDYIYEKINGNGYDYPYVILINDIPIGYIQCTDLYAFRTKCKEIKGLFTNEEPGTFCMDLFIAEEEYLNKGYGTEIVKAFVEKLFDEFHAKKILIDPAETNKRAIRCYEKVGFKFVKLANDGVTDCYVMEINSKK